MSPKALLLILALITPAIASSEECPFDQHLGKLIQKNQSALSQIQAAANTHATRELTLNSGIQIKGPVAAPKFSGELPTYLHFDGPTTLSVEGKVLPGQGLEQHAHGFGSPVGLLNDGKDLARMSTRALSQIGIQKGKIATLTYQSGVTVRGTVSGWVKGKRGLQILTFTDCEVKLADQILFAPEWGVFDMAVGSSVTQIR